MICFLFPDNNTESALYYQGGGSTQSLDRGLSSLWGEKKGERDEDKEEVAGNAFIRTFSFLCKMTTSRK
ncbi:rho guanine nucleotide exchange factor 1a isoform X1, partial [Tachysurus ichikawai]